MKPYFKHKNFILLGLGAFITLSFWFSLSFPLFEDDYSTVLFSRNGALMGAQVAKDQQWRFAQGDSVPQKYISSLITYEDKYFYKHIGVNPLSIIRATMQNIDAKRVVSGGSTITMQLVRIARGRERSIFNKFIEAVQAVRLEMSLSKEEILALYAAHAPFGGNVVGLEAASWRYFQRPAAQLSWAESAMLAVLPNAPGLIHTGKNRNLLLEKRNRLLKKMRDAAIIDSLTYELALDEEIPPHPYPMPQLAPHLFNYLSAKQSGKSYYSSIDESLQERVMQIVQRQYERLSRSDIHNAAVLVVDVSSGKAVVYYGNTPSRGVARHANYVDIIQSKRSTGSVLKPFLHTAALQSGDILPTQLLADIPTYYDNFTPKNFDRQFDGAVPADEALSRSLNIPAVRLLKKYDIARFCSTLRQIGIRSIDKPAQHYGLSLILGGAEASLFELVGGYASMMRTLLTYVDEGVYYDKEFQEPLLLRDEDMQRGVMTNNYPLFSAGAIYTTFEAMAGLARPREELGWQNFASGRKIAWKTGTSFGYRDAWSIGVTPEYVVGVWVGNANGEGRPDIIGGSAAAPIMFDIFRMLPDEGWVSPPTEDLQQAKICRQSGYRAGEYCEADVKLIPRAQSDGGLCPYHSLIHLDETRSYQVNSDFYAVDKMVHQRWFTLPPIMELYYSKSDPLYRKMPPKHPKLMDAKSTVMEFIYPQNWNGIYLPKGIDEKLQPVVIKLAHSNPNATLYWHVNEIYLGETQNMHEKEVVMEAGRHLITVSDEQGNTLRRWIECIGRGDEDDQ